MSLFDWWNRTRYRLYAPLYDRLARPLDRGRERAIERLDLRADDRILLHLILSVVPHPEAVAAETDRVLAPDGSVSVFDKFVPEGEAPSLLRRALNPLARVLFSDLTRRLEPILSETALQADDRGGAVEGLYTVAIAHRPTDG